MKKDRLMYVKVIISACLMVGASVGLCFYCAGSFYEPIAGGLGISLGQAAASTTFMLVFMALAALAVPLLLRKIHFQTLLLIGTALTAASVLGIAFSFNTFWIYLFSSLMGIGASLIGMVPATTMIHNWFEKKQSWTTSVVLAGSALSAAVFAPLFASGIAALGWRMGLVIQAVLVVVMMLPALLFHIQLSPAAADMQPYGYSRTPEPDARKIPDFVLWSFALIAVLGAILIALPMHYSSLATSIGATSILGAQMLSAAMIGNLLFKLAGGWLSAKLKPVLATGIMDLVALCATIGILICVFMRSSSALITLAFFFGSAYSVGELSLPLLVSSRAGRRHFSRLYAVLNAISTLMTAVSISVIGFMYDAMQSYIWIYVIAIAALVVIALILWLLIRNGKADDLVTTESTRSMIMKLRDFEARHRADRAKKAAEHKQAATSSKASSSSAAIPETASDSLSSPYEVLNDEAGAQATDLAAQQMEDAEDTQAADLQPQEESGSSSIELNLEKTEDSDSQKPAEEKTESESSKTE